MSDTPRTDDFCNYVYKNYNDDWNRWQLTANFAAELERELAALHKRFDKLASAAARVEWKFGRNDDGSPKDWTEWNDLRESLGERVRRSQKLTNIDAHLDECVAKSAESWKPMPGDPEQFYPQEGNEHAGK